jgi:hypothetical protein
LKTDFNREKRERRERSVFAKRFRTYPCFAVLEVWIGLNEVMPKVPLSHEGQNRRGLEDPA